MLKLLRPVLPNNPRTTPDFVWFCPGCRCGHGVWITIPNPQTGATWKFSGTIDSPTFEPSFLIGAGTPAVCHSIVSNGIIHFLPDSTHSLSGQSVPMHPF